MTTCRSVRYTPDGAIELIETDVPDPRPHEVQVRGLACGICSWDINTCRLGRRMASPAPPGHEGVGVVTRVGADVVDVRAGDLVAHGGFQELRNYAARGLYRIPPTTLPPHLWLVEPVSCVVTGLDTAHIRAGDRVAVIGSGFMGLVFLQVLHHSPLAHLVAADVSPTRLQLAHELGACEVVNTTAADPDEIAARYRPDLFDVVIDTTGTQQGLDLATRLTRSGGQVNLFGWIKGQQATFDPTDLHVRGISIVNSSPSARLRDPFPPAIRLIQRGVVDLQPLVSHVVPLDEYPALMQRVLGGDPTYLKGVVMLGEPASATDGPGHGKTGVTRARASA